MRTFTAHCVRYRAYQVQKKGFCAGILAGLVFVGCALGNAENAAMAASLAMLFALGISVGAWWSARRFEE